MPAPLAKGLIIAASVLVAAGIAIYESPQVRQWVDQSRRKIAIALRDLSEEIQPRRPSESSDDFEARKRRREELIRRNRNELIRRAREEGVAVDLDELARIGNDEAEMAERRPRRRTTASSTSFDDLVGSDGMLRRSQDGTATGTDMGNTTVRRRGMAGMSAGAGAAAASNPFSDDNILFDLDDTKASVTSPSTMVDDDDAEEATSPKPFAYFESRREQQPAPAVSDDDLELALAISASEEEARRMSIASDNIPSPSPSPAVPAPIFGGQLIDLTPESATLSPENPQTASVPQSEADFNEDDHVAQSFYSFTSSGSLPPHHPTNPALLVEDLDDDMDAVSAGTLTPRSERSAFTGISNISHDASVGGSHADDIAILSLQNDDDHDARSEVFSEGGFTDGGFSEAGFSEVSHGDAEGRGIMTPSSWTDVGSDDESEWGGPAQGGHVSQIHPGPSQ